ncbi:WecB/TagA/CpsF family glycosyltransferase [Sphingomonas sp. LHG3406-1]|uniref:WecB/TagA/CpsF family glycosyltransferase n=1 Tax=Sphingomonas sp. LHG3406-1 TaxID=2804617 RepID=UPI00260C4C96|nr:WecB/TagA/CpsF family glycosyltransferase [Sphingomonas sp. LHG3406-1]
MENFVEQIAMRQVAAGHKVRVVTLNRIFDDGEHRRLPKREVWNGVEVIRIAFAGSRRYPLAPGVMAALSEADIVHVHGVDFFADYLAAMRAVHGKAMVLTTHGGFFHTSFARGLKEVYLKTVTRASLSQYGAVIACSAEDERIFSGVAGERLVLIPNPVDVDKFAGLADPSSETIIYFGRLAPNKEVGRLIDWFAGLAERNPGARLIVAGKPMGVDPDVLRARARDKGLGDRFELHESPSNDALRDLIARSGTYACASSYEGFGLAAVEAASAGLFPLLNDIPPFADTLSRLGYGMTVDFADDAGWPASYDRLARERAAFRHDFTPHEIRERVAPFTWEAALPRFEEVYRKVLGNTSRRIGNVEVSVLERDAAVERILSAVERREPALVTFCNAHTVNLARRDPEFRETLKPFLILNDGIGVDLASRSLFGRAFPDNLNGTDFTPHLLGAAKSRLSVYLVGSRPGVAIEAGHVLKERFPHLEIAGTRDGFFQEEEEASLTEAIRASGADLVLAAMGQPRQEQWAARNAAALNRPIICVGALLDFIAAKVPRAPDMVRRMRLEWAFRLAQEPRRLASRYLLGNATFLAGMIRQKLTGTRI